MTSSKMHLNQRSTVYIYQEGAVAEEWCKENFHWRPQPLGGILILSCRDWMLQLVHQHESITNYIQLPNKPGNSIENSGLHPIVEVEECPPAKRTKRMKQEAKRSFWVMESEISLWTKCALKPKRADAKCSFCDKFTEIIDYHISVLVPNEYKIRHDKISQYLHWKIGNHYQIQTPTNWYEHHPWSRRWERYHSLELH